MSNQLSRCLKCFFLLGLMSASSAYAADDKIIFAISQEPYPPFSWKASSGEWSGFEPDLIREICKQMQADCRFHELAWDGLIPALNSKQADVILNSLSITPERKQVVDFTEAYLQTPALWVAEKALNLTPTPEGLKGKTIGVQGSTSSSSYLKSYFGKTSKVRYYNDQDDVLSDLRNGRIDIMLADQISIEPMLDRPENNMLESKGVAPKDPLFGEGIGAAVRKGEDALRERLNQALAELRKDGRLQTLSAPYFKPDILALD